MKEQRIGIIDIGSNSIRLVIYERTVHGAHRVIDGAKRAARLSQQVDEHGNLGQDAVAQLVDILNHFRMICGLQHVGFIRAVATAAIRNAANSKEVLAQLQAETGLDIELLSGLEEARYGFLGTMNSLDLEDGFLVDIGGGSSEVSLFRGRKLLRTVSFPFGCVSLARRFTSGGLMDAQQMVALEAYIRQALDSEPWIRESSGLPLIAVGGTARAFGKLVQARQHYPLSQTHNYAIDGAAAGELVAMLSPMPLEQRKKFPGLSKDRADVIVPGLAVLHEVFRASGAASYLICGSGLRDGLFFSTRFPHQPLLQDVLTYSVGNLAALHPQAPHAHIQQVRQTAASLLAALADRSALPARTSLCLDAAASLHRIGASIDSYRYESHTFYLIMNAPLNGLSHRELVITAAIASYKTKKRLRQLVLPYERLLEAQDMQHIVRLGTLLQLAVALNRSETQSLRQLGIKIQEGRLDLQPLLGSSELLLERQEVEALADDFSKAWGLTPVLYA